MVDLSCSSLLFRSCSWFCSDVLWEKESSLFIYEETQFQRELMRETPDLRLEPLCLGNFILFVFVWIRTGYFFLLTTLPSPLPSHRPVNIQHCCASQRDSSPAGNASFPGSQCCSLSAVVIRCRQKSMQLEIWFAGAPWDLTQTRNQTLVDFSIKMNP